MSLQDYHSISIGRCQLAVVSAIVSPVAQPAGPCLELPTEDYGLRTTDYGR